MIATLIAASGVVLALWVWLAVLLPRAMREVPRVTEAPAGADATLVSIVVPARNEAMLLPRCLASLAAQDASNTEVLVVDDGSTDDTAALARSVASVRVIASEPRPDGWAGKCWAAWQGAAAVRGEWLLFVDADAVLAPTCVSALVAEARTSGVGLLAAMPRAACATSLEALLQPVMLLMMLWQFDIRRVNDPARETALAPGSFLLFRRDAYDAVGGHEAVRGEIVEDLALARRVKAAGVGLRVVAAPDLVRTERPLSAQQLWRSWTRVTVDGLGRRAWVGVAGAVGALVLMVFPAVCAPFGWIFLALAVAHATAARLVRAELRRGLGIDDKLAWAQPLGALIAAAVLAGAAMLALTGRSPTRWR